MSGPDALGYGEEVHMSGLADLAKQSSAPRQRVVLIEGQHTFSMLLRSVLEAAGHVVLSGDDAPPGALAPWVLRQGATVAVLGSRSGRTRGDDVDLLDQLVCARVPVVILAGAGYQDYRWTVALGSGEATVLRRGTSVPRFVQVVETVGNRAVGPAVGADGPGPHPTERDRQRQIELLERFAQLTGGERVVLDGLMRGFTPAVIAGRGCVSLDTVRGQITGILAKLEVPSRRAAVEAAHRVGIGTTATVVAGTKSDSY